MKLHGKLLLFILFTLIYSTISHSQTLTVKEVNVNSIKAYKIPITLEATTFNEFSLTFSVNDTYISLEKVKLASKLDNNFLKFSESNGIYTITYKELNKETYDNESKLLDLIVRNKESFIDEKLIEFKTVNFINKDKVININTTVENATAYKKAPLITKDTIVFGLLMIALGFIFFSESIESSFWKKFYRIVPGLFIAYMLPATLTTMGLIAPEWETVDKAKNFTAHHTNLYYVASRYLLPAALVLMTLSIDLKAVFNLGWRALVMFFTGTLGIVIGGPIAILLISIISPETVGGTGPDAVWRGLSTLAGSWIGGGANQTAMLEIYGFNQTKYGTMVFVDIVVANVWMAILLIGIGKSERINKWLKADNSSIEELKDKVSTFSAKIKRNPSLTDLMIIAAIAFGTVSLAHLSADFLAPFFEKLISNIESPTTKNIFTFLGSKFFWMISVATIIAILLSFTKAKNYEGAGASKYGSVFIYILVASIGMKMDLTLIFDNVGLIAVGIIWMSIHALLLILVAKIIKAPYFFLAVGSQANVGGAASAPIVASAFHPSLATVGVLLAVFGYAVGTIAAIGCTILMELATIG